MELYGTCPYTGGNSIHWSFEMTTFVRMKDAVAAARKRLALDTPLATRSAVASGGISSGAWGSQLESYDAEIVTLFRQKSFAGRMAGIRRHSRATRAVLPGTGTSAMWVPEQGGVPVTELSFSANGMMPKKIGGIVVATNELLRDAPAASAILQANLAGANAGLADSTLLDPAGDGSGDAPASITHGVSPQTTTGNAAKDISKLVSVFTGDLTQAYLLTTPVIGAGISAALGYGDAGVRGGSALGLPLLTSPGCTSGILALVDPSRLILVEEGIELTLSNSAALLMTGEGSPPSTDLVSLFQAECAAIKAVLPTNWAAAPGCVAYMGSVNYLA
jgi:hypothetical protein